MDSYGVFFEGNGSTHLLVFELVGTIGLCSGMEMTRADLRRYSEDKLGDAFRSGRYPVETISMHRQGNEIQLGDMKKRGIDPVTVKSIVPL